MAVHVQDQRLSLCRTLSLLAALVLGASSCGDRLQSDRTEALGPEKAGVPPGPSHRPGQPCVLCHNEDLGDASPFTLAGTVYLDAMSSEPVGDVQVKIIDSQGRTFTSTTNCAGNFFIRPSEFVPVYPIWVDMDAGMVHRSMETPSFREASCAGCHADPRSASSAGHVYLIDDPSVEMPPPNQCQ